jgi:tRNA G18 (ribose-2'-O)-methylase SpoU
MDDRLLNIRDEFRDMTTEELRQYYLDNSLPYAIMVLNVKDEHNVGNIIRAASLCAVRKVIVYGRRKINVRGCVGAQNYVDIERVNAIRDGDKRDYNDETTLQDVDNILDEEVFVDYITKNNYIPIFIEQDEYSIPATNENIKIILSRIDTKKDTNNNTNCMPCFILGNESFGIPKNILATRKQFNITYTLELKQKGVMRSHNVANCSSILCYKIMECFDEITLK